ncbi:MAG TPA: hypothetical protein GXZ70_00335 [Clostridiales bacterium]|nr:hypothetical protein [Clostridiales bacterium]
MPIDAQYEKEPNYIKNRHLLVIPNNTDTVDDKIKIHEERAYSLHIHLLNGERISIQEFRKIPQFFI